MAGIESRPIDVAHSADNAVEGGSMHPQNVWGSIVLNQTWVLAFVVPGYKESAGANVEELVAEADERRKEDDSYTDRRGIGAIEYLFQVPGGVQSVQDEFRGRRVINIGSGEGILSHQLIQAGAASVADIDFSRRALMASSRIGHAVQADGIKMPIATGSVDRAVSIASTSLHTDTVSSRVDGLLETLRVVDEGGRAFVSPVFATMVRRQMRWFKMRAHAGDKDFYDDEMAQYEALLRKEAAMDYAVTGVIRLLIQSGAVDFTPVLIVGDGPDGKRDNISGIFDVKRGLLSNEIEYLSDLGKVFTKR